MSDVGCASQEDVTGDLIRHNHGSQTTRLLSNSEFLTKLTKLFTPDTKRPRTCFLTQKRFTYQPNGDAIMETSENELTFKCLFRATDGHGIKFSTLVEPEETLVFQKSYSSVLRSGMIAKLKPKKKKVGKSAPATVVSLPKIVGPKRGPGVERRRRLIRRRSKILLKIRRRKVLKAAATTA
ncbi:hypothetical protein MJO28_000590 [Puccinia striiformis f. sp. tritici]|uniref:Signal recognition particle subunit SRP14 n=4 Tax=Puccinia striiformis TaxID=27350 RepID=A0A0L0W5U1_9BASI|nr:hypothetical protein Pst134EA_000656 [Puccinia striiformis f. sp. tritici]KAI9601134.1 hypothetical protein H4Q26_000937 [Puccinia striiformis f. sp. tritici PST-130]KNF06852.1 hypothetical protein PSTG_00166 [Puccinia striiformis f. sp. tritici PST-78]POV99238.1 hypothetical protein PSTT_13908 [Puccinia striiformis]KAH9473577.1 hypothetical protein Pst134EA_000656 [Puccinia striiformis f. sp. tritici]KAI7962496.1 hypothetical protein MJO28_000590 [Puccinia striiformis f. sp. tritici]